MIADSETRTAPPGIGSLAAIRVARSAPQDGPLLLRRLRDPQVAPRRGRASHARFAPRRLAIALALLALGTGCSERARTPGAAPDGARIFAERCSVCHSLPILASLFEQNRGRPPGFVFDALSEGNMRRVGSRLDVAERRAVAEFFTGVSFDSAEAVRDFRISPDCGPERSRFDWSDLAHPSWGGMPRNQRAVSAEQAFAREEIPRLAVDWVVAFPESSQLRSQPTAAGGALFVGSHNGSVYALDQQTGCTRWHFKAATEVRSAVTIDVAPAAGQETGDEARGPMGAPRVRAVFADRAANVYAVDAETGALLWRRVADPHPNAAVTGSVSAWQGRLFVPISSNDDVNSMNPKEPCCTHSGAVVALDAGSGEILWHTKTVPEAPKVIGHTAIGTPVLGPSGASVWNTPTIDAKRGRLYVGSGNNHSRPATDRSDSVLAMDLETGAVLWTYQAQSGDAWNAACIFGTPLSCPDPVGPDVDFGATTVLLEHGGRELLVAGQKAGVLHALDPETGKLVWRQRVARGGPEAGIRYGLAFRDGTLFVPSTDQGDEELRGLTARPGLFALAAEDGALRWSTDVGIVCGEREDCDGAVAAPPLATPTAVFAAGLEGDVFAFDPENGKLLWRFDTTRELATLTGRTTRGGGISGTAGPMVANRRLFVSSGYGQAQRPGNALIAFSVE